MGCKETKNIAGYLNNQLDKIACKNFETHLKSCLRCSAELKIFHKLKETMEEKEQKLPTIDVTNKVLGKIDQSQKKELTQVWKRAAPIIRLKKKGSRK